jgi:hypothetical protein
MRILAIIFLVLGLNIAKAQDRVHAKLLSFIAENTKESTYNRLIGIHLWSSADKASRNLNTEFENAYKIYQNAFLKGGGKGFISVIFCLDKDEVSANITLKKDGISKLICIPVSNSDFESYFKDAKPGYNAIYDRDGNKIYENIPEGKVVESLHKQITR